MKLKNIVLSLSVIAFFSSCYKDLGSYDYDESISDISVKLENIYTTKKSKTEFSYSITPEIDTKKQNKELKYEWFKSTDSRLKGELVGTEKTLNLSFKPSDVLSQEYHLRLYVTDLANNTITMRHTTLQLIEPYYASWIVLHKDNSHAELGAVSYIGGKYEVEPKAYTKARGTSLTGEPHNIGVRQISNKVYASNWLFPIEAQLYLSTSNLDEGGLISTGDNFELKFSWRKLMNAEQINSFDPAKVTGTGYGDIGYAMATNGTIFMNNPYSPIMYQVTPSTTELGEGETKITKFGVSSQAAVGYDEMGRRLIGLDMTGNYWYELEPKTPGKKIEFGKIRVDENNAADPNTIPATQVPIAIFPGYQYGTTGIAPWQQYQLYAYFIDNNKSYVYTIRGRELSSSMDAPISGYYTFDKPLELTENTPMTTGFRYANIIFYAEGNKVYKHNIVNGNTKVIYTHTSVDAKAADIKMAVEGYISSDDYNKRKDIIKTQPERLLGIAFNINGEGELVVLRLDISGDVETESSLYENTQTHRGFGEIKKIVFV